MQETFNTVHGFLGRFETVGAQVAAGGTTPAAPPAVLSAAALAVQWMREDDPLPAGLFQQERLKDCVGLPIPTASGNLIALASRRCAA